MKLRTTSIDPKISSRLNMVNQENRELIAKSLYFFKTLEGAADGSKKISPELSFFHVASGQPDDTGLTTSKEDTNMERPKALGQPYAMWIQAVRCVILPPKDDEKPLLKTYDKAALEKSFVNDAAKLLGRGVVRMKIVDQTIFEIAPIGAIPSEIGMKSASIFGFDANVANSHVVAEGGILPIDVWLQGELTFDFKVEFPAGVFPLYNTLRLGFYLDGFFVRPRQK